LIDALLQQVFNGVIAGSIYTLIGLGLTLLFGVMGVLNFAHGSIAVFGAYVTLWLMARAGLPFAAAMIGAAVVAGLLGLFIEATMFRRTREAPINGLIVSVGLISVFEAALLATFSSTPQSIPPQFDGVLKAGPVVFAEQRLFVLAATAVLLAILYGLLNWTQLGRAVRATAQQPLAARLMGIDIQKIHLVTFATSCVLASFAGALYATLFTFTPLTGSDIVLKAFVVVIVGGMGSLPGAVVGGLSLGLIESVGTQFINSDYQTALVFGLLILILIIRPRGLFGALERQA